MLMDSDRDWQMIGRAQRLPDHLKNNRLGIGFRLGDAMKPEFVAGREMDNHFIIWFRHSVSPKKAPVCTGAVEG